MVCGYKNAILNLLFINTTLKRKCFGDVCPTFYFLPSPSVGAARTYRMLLHRISTSPKSPADSPFLISSAPSICTLIYESVETKLPRYSCPHLSFTATRCPTKDARNGFGLTIFNAISIRSRSCLVCASWCGLKSVSVNLKFCSCILWLIVPPLAVRRPRPFHNELSIRLEPRPLPCAAALNPHRAGYDYGARRANVCSTPSLVPHSTP